MANNFRATDGRLVDLSEIVSSASAALGQSNWEMGTTIRGTNASEWIWAKAGSTTPAYTLNYLLRCNSASFVLAQCKAGLYPGTPVFVSNASVDSGAFAWFQARGQCQLIISGTASVPGALFAATSGVVTDATTTADYIAGVRLYGLTSGSGTMNAWINWPMIDYFAGT